VVLGLRATDGETAGLQYDCNTIGAICWYNLSILKSEFWIH